MHNKAIKKEAYIVRNAGTLRIHLGHLSIDLVSESDDPGPLGWEDGQDPGVIFWKSSYIKKHEDFFEHGEQRELAHAKLGKHDVESLMGAINAEGDES